MTRAHAALATAMIALTAPQEHSPDLDGRLITIAVPDADSAPYVMKSVVVSRFFDWAKRPAVADPVARDGHL